MSPSATNSPQLQRCPSSFFLRPRLDCQSEIYGDMLNNSELSCMQLQIWVWSKDDAAGNNPWENYPHLSRHVEQLLWANVWTWQRAVTSTDIWHVPSRQRGYQVASTGDNLEGLEEVQSVAHEVSRHDDSKQFRGGYRNARCGHESLVSEFACYVRGIEKAQDLCVGAGRLTCCTFLS